MILYPTYLELFDVILDLFDRVSVDVIANINLLLSNHLCLDNWKREKQPTLTSNVFEEKQSKTDVNVMLKIYWIWVCLYLI